VLLVAALAAADSAGARERPACPHATGTLTFQRAGRQHVVSLASCADRVDGETTPYRGRNLDALTRSPDGHWVFYAIDPSHSDSIAADGLDLRVRNVASGRVIHLGVMLLTPDYMTWCGSTLVLTTGGNRLATWNKRLVVAQAPDWRPHALWNASRAFGSVTCAPDGKSVAVLSQRAQDKDWNFFATRWQLWRVDLDGTRILLDAPPPGYADESPAWSPDGTSVAFVRERKGYGGLMIERNGTVFGPLVSLGYSLGYYGHHEWGIAWRR
jgi:dipeptidyl aminopeptidase/acylaminoacyl peptidase